MGRTLPLRGVLYDWDGTLLDSYHADRAAYVEMFRVLGVNWSAEEIDRHYSPDWYRVYRAAGIARRNWQRADRLWARQYGRYRPRLLPGARRVLRWTARRYRLGLVTSGNRARVIRQLRAFDLRGMFAARVCCEDAPRRKPHPAPLRRALAGMRLSPQECLYIGDAPEDIEMARRAGVRAVGVLGPFPTHRRLRQARPDALLKSLAELPDLLRRWS
jgi:HAD superfamily hydrolase (TIGR01509 family)